MKTLNIYCTYYILHILYINHLRYNIRDMAAREPAWEQNGLRPMVSIMQVATAKSWKVREASYQPAFMGSYLTINHMW